MTFSEAYRSMGRCRSPPRFSTDEEVAAIQPTKGHKTYVEGTVAGLYLEVFPSGKRSWVFRYRGPGNKQCKLTIGPFPDITLDEAREQAIRYRKVRFLGNDRTLGIAEFKIRQRKCKVCGEAVDIMHHLCLEHAREFLIHLQKSVTLDTYLNQWLALILGEMANHLSRYRVLIRHNGQLTDRALVRCEAVNRNKGRCTGWASEKIKQHSVCVKCLYKYESGEMLRVLDKRNKWVFLIKN